MSLSVNTNIQHRNKTLKLNVKYASQSVQAKRT